MTRTTRMAALLALVTASSAVVTTAREANAFCGFYVGGAGARMFNDATVVVLMREGTRTVLSMQNTYKGPPEKFAMVVPVPVVLQQENVKTLDRAVFDRIDQLASPRLVEYWEQDPCAQDIDPNIRLGSMNAKRMEAPTAAAAAPGAYGVTIEAKFAVGEYEIVVLGAKDSSGLDAWLRAEHYVIPEGAEPYFRPYVSSGSKFFVAKVDPAKVKLVDGLAELSPLRFHYDSDEFRLPVRLGLINSSGTQDLIVHILGRGTRYEVANYPNVTIPTNLDVAESATERFGTFYAALFDRTLEKNPKAVVTEYAWEPTSCDPCPGPALDFADLTTLGGDVLPSSKRAYDPTLPPPPLRPPLPPSSPSASASPTDCSPPYHYDAQGVKRYKPQCLGSPPGRGVPLPPPAPTPAPPAPTFNAWQGGTMVLTRLHVRYTKDSLGEDVVFKAAAPIVGGREVAGADNALERGAKPSQTNNFQARYAIRHPWTGPIDCKEPHRGVWGAKPEGTDHVDRTKPKAATKLGLVARASNTDLASFVKTDIPELGVTRASSSSPPPSLPDGGTKNGCMGCTVTERADVTTVLPIAALAFLALHRRKQRR